jgi:hypothetical protein
MDASRRWLLAVLGTTLAIATAVGAVNAVVDPFQHYRLAAAPRFYTLMHRYIDPGIAKHARYDTIVSGSSIMENTRADVVDAACGGTAVNLAMPAMSASEQRLIVDTALRARDVRRVIAVLDFNAFAGPPDARQDVAGPLPRYLYDDNPFNDLPYLLSLDVLRKSWAILADSPQGEYRTDAEAPWYWAPRKRFGREEVLRGLDLSDLNARYRQPPRTLDGMRASFDANLLPIVARHPDTEFDIVWPPYSILVWLDFAQRDQLDVTLAFKRYVREALRGFANARIYDLQAESAITHDLDRYTDLYHFDPRVNDWMVRTVCSRAGMDDAMLAEDESRLREQVRRIAQPRALQALAAPRE